MAQGESLAVRYRWTTQWYKFCQYFQTSFVKITHFGTLGTLDIAGVHYQERDSPILGLAISTVAKVSIFIFSFSAKQTKGVVSD